ncbi:hypothetical protein [Clostridium aestuarii]|nr:hypothetical protein [Clostridium aestuarii]
MCKKIFIMFLIVMLLAVSIVVSDLVVGMNIGKYQVGEQLGVVITFFTFGLVIKQIQKGKIKYKYFLIADEFIIYKVRGSRQDVVENIKIKDIKCIKKVSERVEKFDSIKSKKYTCLNSNSNVYSCKYNDDNGTNKFYFEPSGELVNRLYSLIDERIS